MAQALESPTKEHYFADLDKLGSDEAPAWLRALRSAAAEKFREAPYPHGRMEEWRHTNLGPVVNTPYRSAVGPGEHAVTLEAVRPFFYASGAWAEAVFIDGYFAPELSNLDGLPGGVLAGGLAAALYGAGHDVAERNLHQFSQDRSAFTLLNAAFLQDGAFLHVPRNTAVEPPIHFVFVSTGRQSGFAMHPRNLYVLEEGAEAAVVESYVSLHHEADVLSNAVTEASLGPNSRLTHYKLVEAGAGGKHLATMEVHQQRDSRFGSHVFTLSGAVVRNQLCVSLSGDGAECDLNGLYLNDDGRLIDNALNITHVSPHCNSRINYKGVLDGKSHAVFLGKVYVHPEAQKTDSDQLSANLLLSDEAAIDAKPQLEIYADDVKCTHGCTVGPTPEPVIFYFRSRGIDEATARGMLTYGFADEVVAEIGIPALRKRLERYVYDLYSPEDAGAHGD